jgi:hypothetical protein
MLVRRIELEGLRADLDSCTRKLSELQRTLSMAGAINPVQKVVLEQQIKEEKLELERIIGREAILRLSDALLRLDFNDHVYQFRSATRDGQGIAAFLIRPLENGGVEARDSIRLLVKRLLNLIPNPMSTAPIKVRLESNARRSDATALWRELAKKVGPKVHADAQAVTERVVERLRTQNVVLLLTGLDRLDLTVCVRDFWAVIAEAAQQAEERSYYLILLLIDNEGVATLPPVPDSDGIWRPTQPLGLPPVLSFPDADLADWVTNVLDELPASALPRASGLHEAVANLMQRLIPAGSNGDPDLVLWEICDIWACPTEELDAWLET